jgi:hypothetical protein
VGSAYAASSNSFIRWATIDATEYDEFRLSPEYIDSIQEMTHDSSLSPPDDTIVTKYMVSPVSKTQCSPGITEIYNATDSYKSLDEDVVTETEDQQTLSDAEEKSMHAVFANTRATRIMGGKHPSLVL